MTRLMCLLLAALTAPLAAQGEGNLRLTLEEAVRRAEQAPAVLIANARQDAAMGRVQQQRAGLLPSLAVSAGWLNRTFNRRSLGFDLPVPPGTPDLIGPFDNFDARVRLAQPLLDPAAIGRRRAAGSQVQAADADRATVAESAARAAAVAYLRLARATALLAARRIDSALAAELVGLARSQREAGVATPLDVTRARTQLVVAREGIVLGESGVGRARIELARALGLPANTLLTALEPLSDTLARTPAGVAVEAGSLARERRPELRAELARLRAAELAVSAIAAERWPRLELTADYGLNGLTVPDAIATRQVAVQLSLPLLDGFRREGRIDEQRALLVEAAIRQRELERAIDAEVELAALEVKSAAAQAGIAAERRRLAEEELRQARERFAAGVVGNIEVITAQVSLLAARDAEIESRFAAALARVALAAATGTVRELR